MAFKRLYPSQEGPREVTRLMWRLRPFAGGGWIVFPTTNKLTDWLTFEAKVDQSFEIQLVEMTPEEYELLPEEKIQ